MAGAHICWSSCTCSASRFSARWLSTVLHEESEKNQPGVSMVVGARGISGRTPFISMCVGFQTSCSTSLGAQANATSWLVQGGEIRGTCWAHDHCSVSARKKRLPSFMNACGTSYSLFTYVPVELSRVCGNVTGKNVRPLKMGSRGPDHYHTWSKSHTDTYE